MRKIPFNKPYITGKELVYIKQAYSHRQLSGNGVFTKKCHDWLKQRLGCGCAFLTHSGTAALEMAALLIDIMPGDEVIMPAYTFVSTANAFVLQGGVPVFVDIRPDTLNIDQSKIETAITRKTRAIVVVHYAGVSCDMDAIMAIAKKHNLIVIEDAAHGVLASYKSKHLGSMGHLAAISFHETKNIISGEGGALLVNDRRFFERAAIVWEKGTNRNKFLLGQVDKYTWVDKGSSFLPNELTAAFLWAQMEQADNIMKRRLAIWKQYHAACGQIEDQGLLGRPVIPSDCKHNAHMYYVILRNARARRESLAAINNKGIGAVFHYVPLHSSPAGKRFGRISGYPRVAEEMSARIIRLPFWIGLRNRDIGFIVGALSKALRLD